MKKMVSLEDVRLGESERAQETRSQSVFDLFGKATKLRSAEDIALQIDEEQNAWGES